MDALQEFHSLGNNKGSERSTFLGFVFLVNALCHVEEGLGGFEWTHKKEEEKNTFIFLKK